VWKERSLSEGSVAFPAVSGTHVHVATTVGLHTLTLDLEEIAFFPLTGAGISAPAIGPDGAHHYPIGGACLAKPNSRTAETPLLDPRQSVMLSP
jgi:hypothetical protein